MRSTLNVVWAVLVAFSTYCHSATIDATPAWLDRVGEMRVSDPAVARGAGRVQWRSWSAEAFAEAAREKKPVFVFVSANWCHGGNEMERTSLSDVEAAARLNSDYIPIKLDRDAFPETDLRLQQAVAALQNGRGWPLIVVLTSDGEIIHGSTFQSLKDDFEMGKPGFRSTVNQLAEAWKHDNTRISIEAAKFCRALKKNAEQTGLRGTLAPDLLGRSAAKLQAMFERDSGTFALPSPARFPAPRALEVLLAHHIRSGDRKSLECAMLALNAMLAGGIYDQLEGGFHRYSIDRFWRVPRFEKMPVLNAEMVCVLLHAYQMTGAERYRATAERTLAFWLTTLDGKGEFFCASVAPEARSFEDGRYYTWSVREFERLFSDPVDLKLAENYFGVTDGGDQPQTAPGRSVLRKAMPLRDFQATLKIQPAEITARIERITDALRAERKRRTPPPMDATPLCDANAMMAAAFLEAGRLLNRGDFSAQGLRTTRAVLFENGAPRPPRHVLNAPKSVALAVDEAARAWLGAVAFECTGEAIFRSDTEATLARLEANYRDVLRGGYVERSAKSPPDFATALNWRTKSVQDTSEPSSNGLIANAYSKMYALSGDEKYLEFAEIAVSSFGKLIDDPSIYNATLVLAADAVQAGTTRVKVIGKTSNPLTGALMNAALNGYFPWKSVQRFDSLEAAGEVPIANMDGSKPFVMVTRKGGAEIVETVEELVRVLSGGL